MENINPTFIGFLITCVISLAGFVVWLVKKIIALTSDCSETMKDVRNAVTNNTTALTDNSTALRELQKTMITIKN